MALEPVRANGGFEGLELSTRFSWPAIFAGAFIGVGLELFFVTLWSGVIFSSVNPAKGQTFGTSFQIWSVIYICLSLILTFFIGGYAASRYSGQRFRLGAVMHSLVAWAVGAVFVGTLALLAVNTVFSSALSSGTQIATTAVGGVAQGASKVIPQIPPQILSQIQSGNFNRNTLAGDLSKQLNIPQQQALNMINNVSNRAGNINVGRAVRQVAGAVMNFGAALSWASFCAVAVSLFGALAGGAVGASASKEKRAELKQPRRVA